MVAYERCSLTGIANILWFDLESLDILENQSLRRGGCLQQEVAIGDLTVSGDDKNISKNTQIHPKYSNILQQILVLIQKGKCHYLL